MSLAADEDMAADHPVQLGITSPRRFDRVQVVLRIVLAVVLGWLGITAGWLALLLYGTLPLIAAIAVSSSGGNRYADDIGPRVWRVLRWLVRFAAYMLMLVDRFPTQEDGAVLPEVRFTAHPTVGSALLRLFTSIPSAIVLALLWLLSSLLWLIGAIIVLLSTSMPQAILGYQRGIVRWQARLAAYHASLVDAYPPFALDTSEAREEEALAAGV